MFDGFVFFCLFSIQYYENPLRNTMENAAQKFIYSREKKAKQEEEGKNGNTFGLYQC